MLLLLAWCWFCLGRMFSQDLYVSSSDHFIYRIDMTDCSVELVIPLLLQSLTDITFHPNGNLYGLSSDGRLFQIDTMNGTTVPVYAFVHDQSYNSLVASDDGTFYATGREGQLYSYQLAASTATYHGNTGFEATGDLAFYEGELYVAIIDNRIVKIDIADPSQSKIVIQGGQDGSIYGMATLAADCRNATTYAFFSNPHRIYELDFVNRKMEERCSLGFAVFGAASPLEFLPASSLAVDTVYLTRPSCHQSDGALTILASSAIGSDFEYSINGIDFQSSRLFSGLGEGWYEVWVRDENDCIASREVYLANRDAPRIEEVQVNHPYCGEANGSLSIDASSPYGAVTYSLDDVSYQSSPLFAGLTEGVFQIFVQDSSGCKTESAVEIIAQIPPAIEELGLQPTSCGEDNGSLTVEIQNGLPPIQFSLDGMVFQTENSFDSLATGHYLLSIRDGNGCTDSLAFTIEANATPKINEIKATDTSCGEDNGSIVIWATGGAGGLRYFVNDISLGLAITATDLSPGLYTIRVEDVWQCADTVEQEILASDSLWLQNIQAMPDRCADKTGLIQVEAAGGNGGIELFHR